MKLTRSKLKGLRIFDGVSDDAIRVIANTSEEIRISPEISNSANDSIFKQNDRSDFFYIIEYGICQLYRITEHKSPKDTDKKVSIFTHQSFRTAGDQIGVLPALANADLEPVLPGYTSASRAITDVGLLKISKKDALFAMQLSPKLIENIIANISIWYYGYSEHQNWQKGKGSEVDPSGIIKDIILDWIIASEKNYNQTGDDSRIKINIMGLTKSQLIESCGYNDSQMPSKHFRYLVNSGVISSVGNKPGIVIESEKAILENPISPLKVKMLKSIRDADKRLLTPD